MMKFTARPLEVAMEILEPFSTLKRQGCFHYYIPLIPLGYVTLPTLWSRELMVICTAQRPLTGMEKSSDGAPMGRSPCWPHSSTAKALSPWVPFCREQTAPFTAPPNSVEQKGEEQSSDSLRICRH